MHFCRVLAADQHGARSLNELRANELVLEWNACGVDVEAIVMQRSVNDCSRLSRSSPCAAIASTTAIAATAVTVIAVIQVGDCINECARKSKDETWNSLCLAFRLVMAQAIVIVAVRKSTDMQRDYWNRNETCISAAGTHAACPNFGPHFDGEQWLHLKDALLMQKSCVLDQEEVRWYSMSEVVA